MSEISKMIEEVAYLETARVFLLDQVQEKTEAISGKLAEASDALMETMRVVVSPNDQDGCGSCRHSLGYGESQGSA